jgi:hypothetical protein
MKLLRTDFERSVAEYKKWTRTLDDALYELCRRHPDHRDHAGLAAKCWIVGRTYATGIERQIASGGLQGDSMSKLVGWLLKNSSKADRLIDPLRRLRAPLSATALALIMEVHGGLVQLLSGIVRKDETPRSFAAKYLHFHCPLVPIYDSVVARVMPGMVRWRNDLIVFPKPNGADEEYSWYCYRFWHLYQQAREAVGETVTVKLLDYYLLWVGGAPV